MPIAQTRVETPNARKYLAQLAKHFAHKIEVVASDEVARLVFPLGPADLHADDAALAIRVEAPDADGVERLKDVIWSASRSASRISGRPGRRPEAVDGHTSALHHARARHMAGSGPIG